MNAPKAQINRARLLPGLVKRLLFVAILTVGANYFFWRHRIGINLPLYAGVLGLGMIVNGRGLQNNRSFWVFAFLLVGSILAGADAPSLPNFFCLATLLVLLAGICFYRARNPWQRFFRAVLSFWGRLDPGGWGFAATVGGERRSFIDASATCAHQDPFESLARVIQEKTLAIVSVPPVSLRSATPALAASRSAIDLPASVFAYPARERSIAQLLEPRLQNLKTTWSHDPYFSWSWGEFISL
jgi:hypothetical protein